MPRIAVVYGVTNPYNFLVNLLASEVTGFCGEACTLLEASQRVAGIASGPHKALGSCVIIITASSFFQKRPKSTHIAVRSNLERELASQTEDSFIRVKSPQLEEAALGRGLEQLVERMSVVKIKTAILSQDGSQRVRMEALTCLLQQYCQFDKLSCDKFKEESSWIPLEWETWQRGLLFFKKRNKELPRIKAAVLELKGLMQEAEVLFAQLFDTSPSGLMYAEEFSGVLKRTNLPFSLRDFNFLLLSLDTYWVDEIVKLSDFSRAMNRTLPLKEEFNHKYSSSHKFEKSKKIKEVKRRSLFASRQAVRSAITELPSPKQKSSPSIRTVLEQLTTQPCIVASHSRHHSYQVENAVPMSDLLSELEKQDDEARHSPGKRRSTSGIASSTKEVRGPSAQRGGSVVSIIPLDSPKSTPLEFKFSPKAKKIIARMPRSKLKAVISTKPILERGVKSPSNRDILSLDNPFFHTNELSQPQMGAPPAIEPEERDYLGRSSSSFFTDHEGEVCAKETIESEIPLKEANLLLSAISNKALHRKQCRVSLVNEKEKAREKQEQKQECARSLGSWVYNQPGLDNEIIGRADPNRAVRVTGRTKDGIWRRIAFGVGKDGWVFATSLDFVINRLIYQHLEQTPVPLRRTVRKVSRTGSYSRQSTERLNQTAYDNWTSESFTGSAAGSHFHLRQFPKWSAQGTTKVGPTHLILPKAMNQSGEWVHVHTTQGRSGWLPRSFLSSQIDLSINLSKRPGTAGTHGRGGGGGKLNYSTLAAQRRTSRLSDQTTREIREGWKSVTFVGNEELPDNNEQPGPGGDEEGLFKKYWERERSSVVGKKKISTEKVKEVRAIQTQLQEIAKKKIAQARHTAAVFVPRSLDGLEEKRFTLARAFNIGIMKRFHHWKDSTFLGAAYNHFNRTLLASHKQAKLKTKEGIKEARASLEATRYSNATLMRSVRVKSVRRSSLYG